MGSTEELEQAARKALFDQYGSIDRPEGLDASEEEWAGVLGSVLTSDDAFRIDQSYRVTRLVGVVGASEVGAVVRRYVRDDIFPPMEMIDAVADHGVGALEGLEEALLSVPEGWRDNQNLHMHGGNTSNQYALFVNLCLCVMEVCRRDGRAPSDRVRPILEGFLDVYEFNGYSTYAKRIGYLTRLRDACMCLGVEKVAELTAPGDGKVNWDTIGFVPSEERARRVVTELVDPAFWEYKDWSEVERTSTGQGFNRISETFTLLGGVAVPALADQVGKGSAKIRSGVACALGFTGAEAALPELMRVMEDSSSRVRNAATETMLLRFDHDAVREAATPLTSSRKSKVRQSASELIGRLR